MSSDITYMWNLKMIQMNLYTKQKETHRHRKHIYGYQVRRGLGRDKGGVWDEQIHTAMYKIGKKQGPTTQH